MYRECAKCGTFGKLTFLHNHHLIPKFLGGTDADGRILLCERCHTGSPICIHKELAKEFGLKMKEFTLRWLNGNIK